MSTAMRTPGTSSHDVVVLGGGLAGLTLAIQLKRRDPNIDVLVLERRAHPVPEAAFKVGESTVEIGAHYFANVLGLREHLDTRQLRKFGFRFFFSDGRRDIDRCTELGVSKILPTPSWQIDRGRFENFLGEHARALGVRFLDGAVVRELEMSAGDETPHRDRLRLRRRIAARRRPLGGGCQRSRRLAQTQIRSGRKQRPRCECGVVARGRTYRPEPMVGRRRLARALHAAGPLAFDQSHVRRRLLVLADPACPPARIRWASSAMPRSIRWRR